MDNFLEGSHEDSLDDDVLPGHRAFDAQASDVWAHGGIRPEHPTPTLGAWTSLKSGPRPLALPCVTTGVRGGSGS
eukprot:CAMPEP_0171087450 /NCGR_PEP_ID=MMETSP0766_2-20121228/20152_1 /TAXON_ID=439317 /ORGANISM="Gambierdiscus australes, Strain CAWD 149" /LENGTH=74 /DNA_ID=CAMNT_0011545151 /DNA_START=114 /DNA_END=335 /DNA_ORIENTATION=-